MDENDAHDEINRLSERLGKATMFPTQYARGVPSGLIATWGAVSLQPLDPARAAALAAGTEDKPGILVDTIGDLQRSAQLGLPVYRLGGGAGFVWAASWNGRGRGALRMLAIDASLLPGPAAEAKPSTDKPSTDPAAIGSGAAAPDVEIAAPASPPQDGPKSATSTQPVPSAAQSAQKAIEPTPVAAPQAKTPAPTNPPTDVRVVGPPISLRATSTTPTPAPAGSAGGNGMVIYLIALIVLLIGAVGYLLRKSRIAPPAAASAPASVIATPAPTTSPEVPVSQKPEKMDLTALVPAESPASVAGAAGVKPNG